MNYSLQRETILNVLCSTNSHPSAQWVYDEVRKYLPNISLGTVYRNLKKLEAEGIIIKVPVNDNCDRFDGDISCHSHFFCKECKAVTDLPYDASEAIKNVTDTTGNMVEAGSFTFSGVCKKCLKNT